MMSYLSAKHIHWKGILHDCTLHVQKEDFVVLIGPNGCGKSSFLRCLTGWTQPNSGTIELVNTPLHKHSVQKKASTLAFLPQRISVSDNIPVEEWLCNSRFRFQESLKQSKVYVRKTLESKGLSALLKRTWNQLSGGEAQRLALLGLHLQEAEGWILDEPANHLDPKIQQVVYRDIVNAWKNKTTIVIVTHNLNLLFQTVDPSDWHRVKVVGMKDGTIHFSSKLAHSELAQKVANLYDLQGQFIEVNNIKQLYFQVNE